MCYENSFRLNSHKGYKGDILFESISLDSDYIFLPSFTVCSL